MALVDPSSDWPAVARRLYPTSWPRPKAERERMPPSLIHAMQNAGLVRLKLRGQYGGAELVHIETKTLALRMV